MNLNEYQPIVSTSKNLVFANNGNVILCFQGDMQEVYSLSEKNYEELHSDWFQALKNLPSGTVVHKKDVYTKQKFNPVNLPNKSYLQKATYNHFDKRDYIDHVSYLFFTLPKNKQLNNPAYQNPFRSIKKNVIQEMDDNVEAFVTSVNDCINFINASRKIKFTPLSDDAINYENAIYFNGYNDDVLTNIVMEKDKITIGDNHFDILAVNNESCFGESISTSKLDKLYTSEDFVYHQGFIDGLGLRLNGNHIVNQIIYIDEIQKWRKHLEKKQDELKKASQFGSVNASNLKKINRLLEDINNDDTSLIVRGNLNILFWAETEKELKKLFNSIKTEFKEIDILPYYPKGADKKKYFLNSHFCFASNFSNEDLYVTDLKHAICLFKNVTNYKSDEQGIIFNDRIENIPVLKDVWDEDKKRINARNFMIFAPTGEGKSVLANNILRQQLDSGIKLVIIDLGDSYSKFAKLYEKEHILIKYKEGESLGFNPFYIKKGESITGEFVKDLSEFLLELYGEKKEDINLEVSIKKIISAYYKNTKSDHSLNNFYEFLNLNKERLLSALDIKETFFDLDQYLHRMSEYATGGIYAYLFNSSKDESYKLEDKKLIIFELDEVKENKNILAVMLKIIKTAIQRTIWRDRSEKGTVLFEEFAKSLKFDSVLESVEYYYQAMRKQNGSIGTVLQSINQLPKNSTSESMIENTQVLYSLYNTRGYKDLIERFRLSTHDENQLKSLKSNLSGERKYTELFLKIGVESNVFRLELPKEVLTAYLTDGKEHTEIMKLYDKTGDMVKAIEQYNVKN